MRIPPKIATLIVLAGVLVAGRAHAACDTVDVSSPRELKVGQDIPAGTKKIALTGVAGAATVPLWTITGKTLSLDQTKIDKLRDAVATETPAQRDSNRLVFVDSADKTLGDPRCVILPAAAAVAAIPALAAAANAAPVAAAPVVAAAAPPPPVHLNPITDCSALAQNWLQHNDPAGNRIVAFNSKGQECYRDQRTVAQGDTIVTLVAVRKGEDQQNFLPADYSPCSLRSVTPNVNGSASAITAVIKQGALIYDQDQVLVVGHRMCYDDSVTITMKKLDDTQQPATVATLGTATVTQYKRYQASVQLGVLNSDLRDKSFALRSAGGQSLIYNTGPVNRGPEYTISVLLQGLPHYLTQGINYKGRDLVNENTPADRIGLVLSAGLKSPGDRFGLGLSYEIVRGVNLVGVYEWVKTTQLVGYKEGDAFSGTADQIPTQKSWDKGFSLGVSFDITYVTQLFTRN